MYKVYFNISIIHVNCSMHILPPPALRHKDRNLQPAPVLDLTVFYKRPDVDMDEILGLLEKIHDTHGTDFLEYDILFKGICPKCQKKIKDRQIY